MSAQDVRKLVAYRLEQAEESLRDAGVLLGGQGSPRSIVNRSYYAMFYSVLALLLAEGKSASSHAGVLSLFDREFVHAGVFSRQISRDLHQAFDLRHFADYKETACVSPERAREIFARAENFVRTIRQHLADRGRA